MTYDPTLDYKKPALVIINFNLSQQHNIYEWLVERGWHRTTSRGTDTSYLFTQDMLQGEIILYHPQRYNDPEKYIQHNRIAGLPEDDELIIDLHHHTHGLNEVQHWLDVHFPLETPQPPTPTETRTMTPYDTMIEDIIGKTLARLPKQEVLTREQVIELVKPDLQMLQLGIQQQIAEKIKDIGATRLVIEDRRKSPPEIKEFAEPVHCKMPDVVGILKSGCWCCAVGPSGSGKTLGALQYSRVANIPIVCVKQMSRLLAPHDLIGFIDANGRYKAGAWTNAILGHKYDNQQGQIPNGEDVGQEPAIIIIDEMDNANENIIMLVKALPTGQIMMPYGIQRINPNLYVMATMNTWGTGATREYVGRMAQDAALLNEFSFVEWDYDTAFEWSLLENLFNSYKNPGDYTVQHMQMLHSMFKGMRAKAEQQKVRVIISTRNIINTAKKLLENPEWPIHKVLCMDVYKGLKEEDIKRIECPEQWTATMKHGKPASNKTIVATPKAKTTDGIPF